MHDKKLIKKIFNLARYDFVQNHTHFLAITGVLAAMIMSIFFTACYARSDYAMSIWQSIFTMFSDFNHTVLDGTSLRIDIEYSIAQAILIPCLQIIGSCGILIIHLLVIQNCLDLAFDSAMRFFAISWPGLLPVFMILIAFGYALHAFDRIEGFLSIVTMAVYLFFAQFLYLVFMDILEYKKGIWQSVKKIVHIGYHNARLLCFVLFLQSLTVWASLAGIYFCLHTVIKVFIRYLGWFAKILHVPMIRMFTMMVANFFYAWIYLLLYVWICLVCAHVYRQLVCPPVDKPICPSCTSCKK